MIGFWFYVSHRVNEIGQKKVFQFGDISMQVTSTEAIIAAQTNIQWNGEICFSITLPLNSWIYINMELNSTHISIFLNGGPVANSGSCNYPSGNNSAEMKLSIGSFSCIDEFSIFSYPNSNPGTEVTYNWYLYGM